MSTDPASSDRLAQINLDIEVAERRLSEVLSRIAHARSEERLGALYWMVVENERLYTELHDQNLRAAREADSAHAALQEAVRAAETDPLTQLPNRIVLWDRLTHEIALAKRHALPLAVLFLDLDDFKMTNDRLGHEAGDQLLQHVANVLKSTLRASDTVCRIGGDEFVIVAGNVAGDGVRSLIKKIKEAIAEPWELADAVLTQRVSIGASGFPEDGDQAEDLVRKADEAMYLAKLADRARRVALSVCQHQPLAPAARDETH